MKRGSDTGITKIGDRWQPSPAPTSRPIVEMSSTTIDLGCNHYPVELEASYDKSTQKHHQVVGRNKNPGSAVDRDIVFDRVFIENPKRSRLAREI